MIGKVEHTTISRDGQVCEVVISYRHFSDDGEKNFSVVTRPAREVVKLMNIEDTSLWMILLQFIKKQRKF